MRVRKRLTREESKEVTRRRLIVAAERLFVRKGFDDASVEEISETAGYSRGAFYSNFDNKGISLPCGWNSAEGQGEIVLRGITL